MPGNLEADLLAVHEVADDRPRRQRDEQQRERSGQRVVAGIAGHLARHDVIRLPDPVSVEAVAAEADVEAGYVGPSRPGAYRTGQICEGPC